MVRPILEPRWSAHRRLLSVAGSHSAGPSDPRASSNLRALELQIEGITAPETRGVPLEVGEPVEGDAILLLRTGGDRLYELAMALLGHVVADGPKDELDTGRPSLMEPKVRTRCTKDMNGFSR
jgi:hypothetical protein